MSRESRHADVLGGRSGRLSLWSPVSCRVCQFWAGEVGRQHLSAMSPVFGGVILFPQGTSNSSLFFERLPKVSNCSDNVWNPRAASTCRVIGLTFVSRYF